MNELTLIRDHGPDADPVAPAVLARAHADLAAEIRRSALSPFRRKNGLIVGALAAACAALLAIVVVSDTTRSLRAWQRSDPCLAGRHIHPGRVLIIDPWRRVSEVSRGRGVARLTRAR